MSDWAQSTNELTLLRLLPTVPLLLLFTFVLLVSIIISIILLNLLLLKALM